MIIDYFLVMVRAFLVRIGVGFIAHNEENGFLSCCAAKNVSYRRAVNKYFINILTVNIILKFAEKIRIITVFAIFFVSFNGI